MASITELARATINKEFEDENMYSNIDNIIRHLNDDSNFRNLSGLLIETMVTKRNEPCMEDDVSSIKKNLRKLLNVQAKECGLTGSRQNIQQRVDNWIDGKVKTLENRDAAIKICFALKLDLEETNGFLNKLGYNSLLVRDPYDCIYIYCLLKAEKENKYTSDLYGDAEKIKKEYESIVGVQIFSDHLPSSSTPKQLDIIKNEIIRQIPDGYNWPSDEDFVNSFLIKNDGLFKSYRKQFYSNLIKRICEKSGFIPSDDKPVAYAKYIRDKLNDRDADKLPEYSLCMLLDGCFSHVHNRNEAVLICDALNLDFEIKRDFLRSCGFSIDDPKTCSDVIKDIAIEFNLIKRECSNNCDYYLADKCKPTLMEVNKYKALIPDAIYNRIKSQINIESSPFNRKMPSFSKSNLKSVLSYNKNIKYRIQAIEICLALAMPLERANIFIKDCGFSELRVTNPFDAIYVYCLSKNLGVGKAIELIENYNNATISIKQNEICKYENNTNTTILLRDEMYDCSWDNDESFVNRFLKNNITKFSGFSNRCWIEYLKAKNRLMLKIISISIRNEQMESTPFRRQINEEYKNIKLFSRYKGPDKERAKHIIEESSKRRQHLEEKVKNIERITNRLKNNLAKIYDENYFLFRASNALRYYEEEYKKELNNPINDSRSAIAPNRYYFEVLQYIDQLLETNHDIESQRELSRFLSGVISNDALLIARLDSLEANGKYRSGFDSTLIDKTVLKGMGDANDFFRFGTNPDTFNDNSNARKSIIMVQFLSYLIDYTTPLKDDSETEASFSIDDFITKTDNVLSKCYMSKLYYANKYDWLIMKSIKDIELSFDYDINPNNALDEILRFSFGDYLQIENQVVQAYINEWPDDKICGELFSENSNVYDVDEFLDYCKNKFISEIKYMQEEGIDRKSICDFVYRKYGVECSSSGLINRILT